MSEGRKVVLAVGLLAIAVVGFRVFRPWSGNRTTDSEVRGNLAILNGSQTGASPEGAGTTTRPEFEIRMIDAQTGEAIEGLRTGLAGRGAGGIFARFEGTRAGVLARTPRAGDIAYVYKREYDLGVFPLAEGTSIVQGMLEGASDEVAISFAPAKPSVPVAMSVTCVIDGDWRQENEPQYADSPITDFFKVELREEETRVAIPRGMHCRYAFFTSNCIVWPVAGELPSGGVVRVNFEDLHVLEADTVPELAGQVRILMLPDRLRRPSGSPGRAEALATYLNDPSRITASRANGRLRISNVPRAPLHLLVCGGGVSAYSRVDENQETLVRLGDRRRWVVKRLPAGRVFPAGTVFAPGRLDLLSVAQLTTGWREESGAYLRLAAAASEVPEASIPSADWITVWSPGLGLAHVPWESATVEDSSFGDSELVVEVPSGCTFSGTSYLSSAWDTPDSVFNVAAEEVLTMEWKGVDSLKFGRFPAGTYLLRVSGVLASERTSGSGTLMRSITLLPGIRTEVELPRPQPPPR